MVAAIHHVRCGDCAACQEYALTPQQAPLCRLAYAMTTLGGTDPVRMRRLRDCEALGWVSRDHSGNWHATTRGASVVLRAAQTAAKIARLAEVAS